MQPTYRWRRDPGSHGVPFFLTNDAFTALRPRVTNAHILRRCSWADGPSCDQTGGVELARRSETRRGMLVWASCIVTPSKGLIR